MTYSIPDFTEVRLFSCHNTKAAKHLSSSTSIPLYISIELKANCPGAESKEEPCPEAKQEIQNPIPNALEKKHETKDRFNKSLNHFLNGAVSVNRKNLFDAFDFGVPISDNASSQNTLILYDSTRALPTDTTIKNAATSNSDIPEMDALDATANCDAMNVLFIKNPASGLRQCYALVGGQYQGYHVQRWMRIEGEGAHGKVNANSPLHQVSRMVSASGYDELTMPKEWHLKLHRVIMLTYLTHLKEMQDDLKVTLQKTAVDNTVVGKPLFYVLETNRLNSSDLLCRAVTFFYLFIIQPFPKSQLLAFKHYFLSLTHNSFTVVLLPCSYDSE